MDKPNNTELIASAELLKTRKVIRKDIDISRLTGFSKSVVSNYLNGRVQASQNFIDKFCEVFKIDSFDNFLKTDNNYIAVRRDQKINGKGTGKRIPFYDAEATAGIVETEMSPIHAPSGTIDVGDLLHDSQAAIRIYGNSMLPNYPPGCVVGLNRVTENFIEPGEVYVIETSDRRVLKRLFYKDDDSSSDYFMLYSDNTMKYEGGARDGKLAYPPTIIPKSLIINLFAVTGVIKRNTNSVIINR